MSKFAEFLNAIAKKWQNEWLKSRIFEADPDESKPKFFVTAAFPYPNAPLHMGHGRTYTIADVYARFKRMQGFNVLFPMGFHYTGTPILTMAEAIASGDKETIDFFTEVYFVPKEDLPKLTTPLGMAKYFHENMKKGMIELGLSIDWRREFTTIDPEFNKFIEWQFLKLKEKGYIVKGSHPVGWCPVHNMPVGMHDTKGDVEPEIGEYTLILFKLEDEDVYLPAATLRPETVFGVTNIWLNPRAEYVEVLVDNKKWIVSSRAAFKLRFQRDNIKELRKINPQTLFGKHVVNPATGEKVPILPADFVDPDTATGIVMSVPAHAPFDYAALRDLQEGKAFPEYKELASKIKPIPVISVKGFSEIPARDAVEKTGATSQKDREKLEEATKIVYSEEFKHGVMRVDIVERVYKGLPGEEFAKAAVKAWIAGKSVPEAREATTAWLRALGYADKMYEIMNRPVYCRCGNEIVVKVLKNQWFINYGDKEWKKLAYEALESMRIVPEQVREEFKHAIGWLNLRAAARTRGLGTPLPWDRNWIIESLSDSTIYMAFYTVIHKIRRYSIGAEKLTPEFWDYVLLGKGSPRRLSEKLGVSVNVLEELRREFDYWYPVDSRHSGKDLVPNHLTFYIFNHVAIFPREKWPRQIVVNGFVKLEGMKMSKSLRNVIPLRNMLKAYGPDTVRAALILAAEIGQDADFRDALARGVLSQLERIYRLVSSIASKSPARAEDSLAERWLLSRLQTRIDEVTRLMEDMRFRQALVILLYESVKDIEKYVELGGKLETETVRRYVDAWIRMLAPFIPHLAEEMWRLAGKKGYVSTAEWPKPKPELRDPWVELAVAYADMVIEDVERIAEALKRRPKKVVVAVAPKEVWNIVVKAIELIENNVPTKQAVREIVNSLPREWKRAAKHIPRMLERIAGIDEPLRSTIKNLKEFNEYEALSKLSTYIAKRLGVEELKILSIEEAKSLLPQEKITQVLPLRPAILVE